MREIKFRVFTDNEMIYIKHEGDYQLNFGINDCWSLWSPYAEECTHVDGKLMQFTGLQDKDGVEIYEGDIIKSSLGRIAVVEWEKEGRFLGFETDRRILYINREPIVKIIGNIFEHPDLVGSERGCRNAHDLFSNIPKGT